MVDAPVPAELDVQSERESEESSSNGTLKLHDQHRTDSYQRHRRRRSSGSSGSSEHSASLEDVSVISEQDTHLQQIIPKIAGKMAEMDVTNPEVMRVAPAFCAFQDFAKALRTGYDGDFYHKSFKSHKISTFWSHSWHGGHWKKILTLLTIYNAPAALFCGFLTAILMMILFCFGLLPSFDRQHPLVAQFSAWCLPSGFAVATLVMLFWRSRTKVFLDRLCISQTDNTLKAQAIFSLAGLLKNSDVMLILWDPTWTERLWCLFELAAFLKSKKTTEKQVLIVRPIFLAPISIAVFLFSFAVALPLTTVSLTELYVMGLVFVLGPALLIGVTVGYPTVMTVRSYFRELEIMKEQLLNISFDATRSSCCDKNHLSESGATLLCDRKVVKECVKIWFGSQEAFEHVVRSEVLDILIRVLSEEVFTTKWVLGVTFPFLWAFLDLSASFAQYDGYPSFLRHGSMTLFVEGLMLWLVAFPGVKDLLIVTCRFTRAKGTTLCIEMLKNLMVVITCASFLSILLALYLGTRYAGDEFERAVAWSGGVVLFSISSRLGSVAINLMLKRFGW